MGSTPGQDDGSVTLFPLGEEGTDFPTITTRLNQHLASQLGPDKHLFSGSVVRTLLEAYAREMAIFYGMLEHAHRSGYLDTAEGPALDNVVSLLGVERARAGLLSGQVTFRRLSKAERDIVIPVGYRVMKPRPAPGSRSSSAATSDGGSADKLQLLFETTEEAVLQAGESSVTVTVRQVLEENNPAQAAVESVAAHQISVMPRPLMGIDSVTNPVPFTRTAQDETDALLRGRTRRSLQGSQAGTLEAMAAKLRESGFQQVDVREPSSGVPGIVEVWIGDDVKTEEQRRAIDRAIQLTRPAGIRVLIHFQRTWFILLEVQVELADDTLDDGSFGRLKTELTQALQQGVLNHPTETSLPLAKLVAPLMTHAALKGVVLSTVSLRAKTEDGTLAPPHEPNSSRAATGQTLVVNKGEVLRLRVDGDWPHLVRRRPRILLLDLTVTRQPADTRKPENIRDAARTLLEAYFQQLSADVEKPIKLSFAGLARALEPADLGLGDVVLSLEGQTFSLDATQHPDWTEETSDDGRVKAEVKVAQLKLGNIQVLKAVPV